MQGDQLILASLRDAVRALTRYGEADIASSLGRLLEEPEVRGVQLYKSSAVAALAEKSILKNLNAITVAQAVVIAVEQRLLEILPYFEDDI